ncbi:MAG: hypothetical protein GX250_00850 [Clostridiales bacterium]|nr:hypothetical protein [Clostridiales bacterium]
MQLHNDTAPNYQPLLLLRNIKYPTFQLHAVASGCGIDTESVLKIVILETMQWLRQRFRAFELPKELDMSEASCFSEFELNALKSFHLDVGYRLEIIWIPENKIWTLQLTEPDLGTKPGELNPERLPVPGRLIETNISYVVKSGGVECGFKTIVSEPEGTEGQCEVFRYAFIKHLARNPLIRLSQTWQLIDKAHQITSISDLKKLRAWLADKERMMPAVIIAEYTPDKKTIPEIPELPVFKFGPPVLSQRKLELELPQEEPVQSIPMDLSDLIRYRMGYAQFFILPASLRAEYNKNIGQEIGDGEINIVEPKKFGGYIGRFTYYEITQNPKKVKEELDLYIQTYARGKEMAYGNCVFVPKAKELERNKIITARNSKEEVVDYYEDKIREKEEEYRRNLDSYRKEICDRDNKIARLYSKIDELEKDKKAISEEIEKVSSEYQKKIKAINGVISRYEALLNRPKGPDGVNAWVEKYLCGKLIFHERAKDKMRKITPEKVNLPLVCDALEHLATDFRDELLGLINENERRHRCSQKYNRNFEIVLTKGPAVDMYPGEYKIKYRIGYKGKPVETLLDYHLKVGNDSENLLRIYFLYDEEKELIVVGSLPEHLSTSSYK